MSRESRSSDKMRAIRYLKENLETASKLMLTETPEDVAIFIGTTKSGKSTLLNCLLGNKLVGVRDPRLRSIFIEKADGKLGPEIGRGPTSETIYPTRWDSSEKLSGLVLWDSPGFEDNRGPVQDIINAFYVYRLFGNIKSAKIVLVTDVNDVLNDRINPFLSLLTSVENLFKDKLSSCFSNIIVAFTKVPSTLDDEPVDVNFISQVLDHQILSSDSMDMSQSTKNFIRHVKRHPEQIGLFKKASVGPIPSDADGEIVQAIRSISGVERKILQTVSPSIAHASKVFLYEIRHDLTSSDSFTELEKSIKAAFKVILNEFKDRIEDAESQKDLPEIKEELILFKDEIQQIIDAKSSFHSKIELLKKMNPKFKDKIEANDLIERSKLMEFIDGVLDLQECQIFNINLRSVMEKTKSEVNEIIIDVQLKLHEISKKEAEEEIKKIQKEKEDMEKEAKEERKKAEKKNEESEKRLFTVLGEKIDDGLEWISRNVNFKFPWQK